MVSISRILLITIIVILVLAFIPKYNGTVICFGCEDRECECLGIGRDKNGTDICAGIPYNCERIENKTWEATG